MRLKHLFPVPLLVTVCAFGAHVAAEPLFKSAPLSEAELGQARGGFMLPNGLNIDFGVLVSTRVDGMAVLQTELRIAGDDIQSTVTTAAGQQIHIAGIGQASIGADGAPQAVIGGVAGEASGDGAQAQAGGWSAQVSQAGGSAQFGSVAVEGSHAGAQAQLGNVQLSVGQGAARVEFPSIKVGAAQGSGLSAAPPSAPPASSAAPIGHTVVSISDIGVLATADLPDLLVRHAIGREISSMIVNTANGRVIDNEVSINLRLDDVQPFSLGSVGYRVQSLGVEAALSRAVGG